jgi:predicted nucleic acid-binding protein
VKPAETGDEALRARYEDAIVTAATLIPLSRDAAQAYASIRRDRSIRAPDAIQLACAASARIDLFVTNDDRLTSKSVPGIHFIQSVRRAFL